jgi:hypothetical protein
MIHSPTTQEVSFSGAGSGHAKALVERPAEYKAVLIQKLLSKVPEWKSKSREVSNLE